MPRAFDRNPQKRGLGNSIWNPNRSGIADYSDPMSAIDAAAQSAGAGIRKRFEDTADQALDGLVESVLNITGIDISGPVELLEQLLGIPLEFLDATTLGSALDVLGQFFPFLPGSTSTDFDPIAAAAAFITGTLSPTGLIANWQQLYQKITGGAGALDELGDLFQHGLFGQIDSNRLGQVSAAAIDNMNPETLDNPGFDTDVSIRDNDEVEWDGTFGRTRPGSMKIVAGGSTHTAVSNPLRVVQNRQINVSVWTHFTGVTAVASSTPIRLSVDAYVDAPTPGDPPVFVASTLVPAAVIDSPAGNSADVAGAVDGWVLISGSYTVPAGVDVVVNKLQVTEDCTAGVVHFDDGSRKRAGLLPKDYVDGLLADLADHAAKIQATINKAWEAVTNLPATVDKSIDELKTALQNIPQANIKDLATALASAGQGVRDAIVHALGGPASGNDDLAVVSYLLAIPLQNVLGLPDIKTIVETIRDILAGVPTVPTLPIFQDIKDWWTGLNQKTQGLNTSGQLDGANIVGTVAKGTVEGLVDLGTALGDGFKGIFDGWFGSGGTGTPAEVQQTMEAIKDAVINGYTVQTFTTSTANVPKPTGTEVIAILVGSGQLGTAGTKGVSSGTVGAPGGNGGLDGSYIAIQLDAPSLPSTLDIQVGANGAKSYVRAGNGAYTGTILAESAAPGSPGGIQTALGFTATSSTPGAGGKGGNGSYTGDVGATAGTAGEPSTLGAGGTAGAGGSSPGTGGAGGTVSAGAPVKCGGGGGGGGGGGSGAVFGNGRAGGPGGNGGFPGGGTGGGGGGAYAASSSGNGGAPGSVPGGGCVWLFSR